MSLEKILSGVLLVVLLQVAVACGESTQYRRGDSLHKASSREPVVVELEQDVTWLVTALGREHIYLFGQPANSDSYSTPERYVAALDKNSGKELWKEEFVLPSSAMGSYNFFISADSDSLVLVGDYVLLGFSKKDGKVLWTIETEGNYATMIGVKDDLLWVNVYYSQELRAYNVKDGSLAETIPMANYNSVSSAWLSGDGREILAVAEPANSGGQWAFLRVNIETKDINEVVKVDYYSSSYEERMLVGPNLFSASGALEYGRGDYGVQITKSNETISVKGWKDSEDEAWSFEEKNHLANDYSSASYSRRFYPTLNYGVFQEPATPGVLLNKVLRIQVYQAGGEPIWTTVIPSSGYIDGVMEYPGHKILVHSRSEMDASERWYLFDGQGGELLWMNEEQGFYGSARSYDCDGKLLVRLMTMDWVNSSLLINEI